jgi:pimeloyl-ACP methyl ester carboxylesterase
MLTRETVRLASGRDQIVFRGGTEGPVLVWLHGIGGLDPEEPVLEALGARFRIVAPLAPGFDDLSELDGIRDVHDLALHFDDLLEAERIDHAVLAGHSFGAMVAAEIAAHVPRRVSRLVLAAPFGLWNDAYPVPDLFAIPYHELASQLHAGSATPGPMGAVGDLRVMIGSAALVEEGDVESVVSAVQGLACLAKFMFPIPDRGLRRRLYRASMPALAVFGEADRVLPARYAEDWAAELPDGRVRVVPDAGHMLPQEHPEELLAAIEQFLAHTSA